MVILCSISQAVQEARCDNKDDLGKPRPMNFRWTPRIATWWKRATDTSSLKGWEGIGIGGNVDKDDAIRVKYDTQCRAHSDRT